MTQLPLSREQFKVTLGLLVHSDTDYQHAEKFYQEILDTDAALRAEVEGLKQVIAAVNTDGLSDAVMKAIIERNALTAQLAASQAELDTANYENAHTNEQTRQTLFDGIKERDIKMQALEKQLAAMTQERDALLQENTNRRCTLGDLAHEMQQLHKRFADKVRDCVTLKGQLTASEARVRELEAETKHGQQCDEMEGT